MITGLQDKNELDKAIACYSAALSSNPQFSHSLNNLAVIYTVQGKVRIFSSKLSMSDVIILGTYQGRGRARAPHEGRGGESLLCRGI